LQNVKKTHYEIEELYKEGFSEQTDVKQLRISINELENAIRSLDQQIEIAYKLLKLQMGLPLDKPIRLSGSLNSIVKDINIDEQREVEFNPFNNVNLRALITQEELARLSLRNEKTTFLPTLAAFGSLQRDAQRQEFDIFNNKKDWYPTTIVGVQFSWPLFSGGGKVFRVQKAKIELKQTTLKKEQVKEGLTLQYNQAKSELISAEDRFENAKDNRDLALEVYEVTQEKFREGISSSLELTQAHNQYLNSERDFLQSMTDLLNADTELKKILEIL
jgi:outer membrane protein TolC